jgi:hypothetical protein
VCVVGKNYRLQDIQLSKFFRSAASRPRVAGLEKLELAADFCACLAKARAMRSSFNEPKAGGEYRARTGDLLVANQALSQLS